MPFVYGFSASSSLTCPPDLSEERVAGIDHCIREVHAIRALYIGDRSASLKEIVEDTWSPQARARGAPPYTMVWEWHDPSEPRALQTLLSHPAVPNITVDNCGPGTSIPPDVAPSGKSPNGCDLEVYSMRFMPDGYTYLYESPFNSCGDKETLQEFEASFQVNHTTEHVAMVLDERGTLYDTKAGGKRYNLLCKYAETCVFGYLSKLPGCPTDCHS